MLPQTMHALRDLYAQKKTSPSEILTDLLALIERKEPVVKAWTELHAEEALASAKTLDQMLTRADTLPSLFGIPYGAKDIFHTAGWRTEAGSKVLAGFIPQDDATVVTRLRTERTILLGKTTTTEFANWGGPPATTNAWNSAHTPGGSSSGSAAAVASGMALFALGTQTAGSLTRPAAYNGLTVLKPSYGRISKAGVIPASISLDHISAFTRDVEDTTLFYNAVAGHDPLDPCSLSTAVLPLTLKAAPPPAIGILDTSYFRDADADVLRNYEAALKTLSEAGCRLLEIPTPKGFEAHLDAHAMVMQTEVAHYHRRYFPERADAYTPYLRDYIAEGLQITADRYIDAQETRRSYRLRFAEAFATVDLLATPSTPTTAPLGLEATGTPAYNRPFTSLGIPTLALPNGFGDQGLPTSLQLVAPLHQEQRLIDAGYLYQLLTDWHLRTPK